MIYTLLQLLIPPLARTFFKRIEVHGQEKIPHGCPLLFTANHPNMVLDPILVGMHHRGRVSFLAKSTLFNPAPVGWLLRSMGGIPVYRKSDNPAQMGKNQEAFRDCFAELVAGRAIGIFPEGVSAYAPRLHKLKTGAARIVLECESLNEYKLGVRIVPVGLNYLERDKFLSDVLVQFGDPIDPSEHFESFRVDQEQAARALTGRISASLETLTRNLESAEDAAFVDRVRSFYLTAILPRTDEGPPGDLKRVLEIDQALADAKAHFLATQPDRTRDIMTRLDTYLFFIDRLGLTDGTVSGALGLRTLAWTVLGGMPIFLLGLPVVVYGVLTSGVPYQLVGALANRRSTDLAEFATMKLGLGSVLYPLTYVLLGWVSALQWGLVTALLLVATMPAAGMVTLLILDRWRDLASSIRMAGLFFRERNLAQKLRTEREAITGELLAMRQEWVGGQSIASSPAVSMVP